MASNDSISRQAAIDAIDKCACNTQRIYEAIKGLPAVQPERKTGKWIVVTSYLSKKRVAINFQYVVSVRENSTDDCYNGKRANIDFSDGTSMEVYDSFDEIRGKIG